MHCIVWRSLVKALRVRPVSDSTDRSELESNFGSTKCVPPMMTNNNKPAVQGSSSTATLVTINFVATSIMYVLTKSSLGMFSFCSTFKITGKQSALW